MTRWLSKEEIRKRRRLVVHLRDKIGLTPSQVAERLGICIGTVNNDYRKQKEAIMIKRPPLGEEEK